jgi:hypothetical protein
MADEPWRVNFPVCTDPVDKVQHIIIWHKPIENAIPWQPPTMCYVVGMDRKGQHRKFTVSLEEYSRACLTPVHFIEADNIRGPSGGLVDPTGKVLT